MLYISIDVGIRNLAYIIINVETETSKIDIVEWKVIELCEPTDNACKVDNTVIGKNICKRLKYLIDDFVFDKVIIENQIGRNAIKMKSIQSMLVMFFVANNYDETSIVNYNAANKLKFFLGKRKTTYAERKKMSKMIVADICRNAYKERYDFFTKSKKKDDLSDCFLQALDYVIKFSHITPSIYDNVKIVV